MGMTVTEKILSKACGRNVRPDEIVEARVDKLMVVDMSAPIVFGQFEKLGTTQLRDPDQLVIVTDHFGSGHDVKSSNMIQKTRDYVKKYNVRHFYDHGRNGVCHQIMAENGHVLPGTVAVGTDSHATTYGALGAFGCGVSSTEAAVIMVAGSVWFRVPGSIRVELKGTLPPSCCGKDVALKIMTLLGCDQVALYSAVEVVGKGVGSLTMDDRLALCNMLAESGAKNCIVPADSITREYLRDKTEHPYEEVVSDPDANYAGEFAVNLDQMVPLVAKPHTSDNAVPVTDLEGTPITAAYFGSCTSGRLSEFEIAAKILRGKKLPSHIVLRMIPSSQTILLEAIDRGYVSALMAAGAVVEASSCAACAGLHTGVAPDNAVVISTTNRNFKGRMGSMLSSVYLASAATVIASALEGKITDPRKYL